MNDRGEKIIHLARELLDTTPEIKVPEASSADHAPLSYKTVFLAALLAAFGSSALTHWIDEARRPINRYERVELEALLFYATTTQSLDEASLRQELNNKLAVASFDHITALDYRRARDFLRDKIR